MILTSGLCRDCTNNYVGSVTRLMNGRHSTPPRVTPGIAAKNLTARLVDESILPQKISFMVAL